ncbi:MAG TPA: hypothetical protein PKU69_01400 [Bacillota bacterium]|nr:hypothetical protein [Bacillota bacterium]
MKKWLKDKALIITLWAILLFIFIVGGIYFDHIKAGMISLLPIINVLGGGV